MWFALTSYKITNRTRQACRGFFYVQSNLENPYCTTDKLNTKCMVAKPIS